MASSNTTPPTPAAPFAKTLANTPLSPKMGPSFRFSEALSELDDKRIKKIKPLIPPQIIVEEYPLSLNAAQTVLAGRLATDAIIKGNDDRLLVVVGPCSVHDAHAALEYARLLKTYADEAAEDLHIVMRVYFEKPRTTVGWKGLINDPDLNGSFNINKGLKLARGLLLEINNMGLPAGTEFLDSISPQFTADLISWGAIGARTTESQVHRELASGLSCAIGFKNGTDGSIGIAVDAIRSASSPHAFMGVTKQGISAIVQTEGNDTCHVILRGANKGPNYHPQDVSEVIKKLTAAKLAPKIMIDASHGNSEKKHENQSKVVESVYEQLSGGSGAENARAIMGVMIESNLVEGKQSIPPEGPVGLTRGQSVTDACINWDTTLLALNKLRAGVQARRKTNPLFSSSSASPSRPGSVGPNDAMLDILGKGVIG
ncbi:unnamed protein product [Tilletia laevis]|uniref:3-deoxy-7-phosphoheptulonate synthase n=3 Tax=Tilletia TaxID=13289 RepID=A0A8X7MKF0_9BASI|nr:hypothetical protein CF335_g7469 [Tilletia laevis]KAE8239247.1 hypothetical protein A4X06_0g8423 [Tilletia controversa]KAE8246107.1 hypothetical protein A4X03_0g7332 [Tilletia caries]KAE8188430.1 hypothetical protein CF336_g6158 [Tilletia laevis]CAD6892812.1 unnamed protein product [Tilletia caries]